MKKTYITPNIECNHLHLEGTIAVSAYDKEGDGWHTNKKSGWDSDSWSTPTTEEVAE